MKIGTDKKKVSKQNTVFTSLNAYHNNSPHQHCISCHSPHFIPPMPPMLHMMTHHQHFHPYQSYHHHHHILMHRPPHSVDINTHTRSCKQHPPQSTIPAPFSYHQHQPGSIVPLGHYFPPPYYPAAYGHPYAHHPFLPVGFQHPP